MRQFVIAIEQLKSILIRRIRTSGEVEQTCKYIFGLLSLTSTISNSVTYSQVQ